jgi:hypothetical protein
MKLNKRGQEMKRLTLIFLGLAIVLVTKKNILGVRSLLDK